jgi:Holliday junction resolvase RusA-like endonuclease
MIEFEIPSVVPKGRPRTTRTGHMYTPTKTRNAEALVKMMASEAVGRDGVPMEGPLSVTIIAHLPIPRSWSKKRQAMAADGFILPAKRPDLDNIIKLVTDGANGICYLDDRQICAINALKIYDKRPHTEVRVQIMDGLREMDIAGEG